MKALVSLSGGLDSTVLLSVLKSDPTIDILATVNFQYGSKHNLYEMLAAERVAKFYGLPYKCIQAHSIFDGFKSDLLQTGGDIPEGHYEHESMRRTVVPCRNMIFLSTLAGLAESIGADRVFIGVHSGDHHIYPDCRPEFIDAMKTSIHAATDGKVALSAPFLYLNKGQIVKHGLVHNAPLSLTRTCYKDVSVACGKCGSCQERLEAFALNKTIDPIGYQPL